MRPVLLLDLDKTLVDLEDHTDWCAAVAAVRDHLGSLPKPPPMPETGWGRCALEAMEILVALSGRPEWREASDLIEAHEVHGAEEARAMPGLERFLEATAGRPRAIVTLCGPRSTRRVAERFGIDVDAVIPRTPEHRIKPAPDQVLAALEALGAAPEDAVMVGDSSWDEGAARAAGVAFVALTNGRDEHREQFGDGCPVATDLDAAIPLL
ncbi:MAG: HAD family hydrolase [Sandaracinaceae bacterium]